MSGTAGKGTDAEKARRRRSRADEARGDADQYARFVETARQLGCDEDEEAFQRALRKVATAAPVKRPDPPDKS